MRINGCKCDSPHFYRDRIFELMPRTGEMHQCIQKLTCKIITLSWNNRPTLNTVMTFNLYDLENLLY